MESDSLDDFDYFVDAYLCLSGLQADKEDIAAMKENRVILLDQDSKAEWLIKSGSDAAVENTKNRLDNDIHKFAGNASGVAIKYKTMPMENVVAIKERKFKKGLQRRIELIYVILALKGSAFDWRSIDIIFTRNLPTNETEIANVVNTLSNVVSTETLLAQIPFVENVDDEMKRLEEEKKSNPFYDVRLGLNGEDDEGTQED
jgi:SPP1 family phage portal protein